MFPSKKALKNFYIKKKEGSNISEIFVPRKPGKMVFVAKVRNLNFIRFLFLKKKFQLFIIIFLKFQTFKYLEVFFSNIRYL